MRCDEMFTLSQMVVGYHFCQLDNSITCYVPEFVHSLAAQLYQAPQMEAYRQQLISESHLQVIISFELYYHYTICPLCELLHCMHICTRSLYIIIIKGKLVSSAALWLRVLNNNMRSQREQFGSEIAAAGLFFNECDLIFAEPGFHRGVHRWSRPSVLPRHSRAAHFSGAAWQNCLFHALRHPNWRLGWSWISQVNFLHMQMSNA